MADGSSADLRRGGRTDPPSPHRRNLGKIALLAAGAAALALASVTIGSVSIPASTTFGILLRAATGGAVGFGACATGGDPTSPCGIRAEILLDVRLPEILLALLAGACLGLSGGTLQGVFRNPLADPYLLGLSSGGTLGAALVFVFGFDLAIANLVLPLVAFAGAMGTGLVILLAARGRRGSVESLLLTGVALASFLSAALSVVLLYNPIGSEQVSYWLLGGLLGATWNRDGIVLGGLLIAAGLIVLHGRSLNVLQLGPDVAQSLGVDARAVRWRLLLLASFATALAVAYTGVIGFVGLVSPHVIRRTISTDYRIVLPGAAVVGGLFLLSARDLATLALPTAALPVGIFTSFAGAPFFLYLLYRQRQASTMGGP